MTPSVLLNIQGSPIQFSGLKSGAVRARLGHIGVKKGRGKAALFVQFVSSLRGFQEKGFQETSSRLLLGDRFALDYSRRIMYFPLRASIRTGDSARQGQHFLLPRAIFFSLSLLYEMNTSIPTSVAGLYLHASAVETRKGALVFCGESTFGKSTISEKLLTPFPKLEDDQVLIRMSTSARGTKPEVLVFGKGLRRLRNRRVKDAIPIAGIFWLKKSPDFAIESMDRATFASKIFSPMINWTEPQAVIRRLKALRTLLDAVPCAELSFAKESAPLIKLLRDRGFA